MNPLSPYTPDTAPSAEGFRALIEETRALIAGAMSDEEFEALRKARVGAGGGSCSVCRRRDVGEALGVTEQAVSRWCSGASPVSEVAYQAMLALHATVERDPEKARRVLLQEIEGSNTEEA